MTFISNKVMEIQMSQKRMKLFEYIKSYNGFVFLRETHSTVREEKKWEDELNDKLFFSHGKNKFMGSFNWLLWNQKNRSN